MLELSSLMRNACDATLLRAGDVSLATAFREVPRLHRFPEVRLGADGVRHPQAERLRAG